jgi:hypothetical protein
MQKEDRKEGQEFRSLELREASSLHLKREMKQNKWKQNRKGNERAKNEVTNYFQSSFFRDNTFLITFTVTLQP